MTILQRLKIEEINVRKLIKMNKIGRKKSYTCLTLFSTSVTFVTFYSAQDASKYKIIFCQKSIVG